MRPGGEPVLAAHTRIDIVNPSPTRLVWLGSSLDDVRRFPTAARQAAGFQLWRLQLGLLPNDWKPMPSIGPGVRELRVHVRGEHRLIYLANRPRAVFVLHAFPKRSRKTSRGDIEIGRARLKELSERRHGIDP